MNNDIYLTERIGKINFCGANPNPPSKVLCRSDYGLQRTDVTSHSTVSPGRGCGFDQNDRADINPLPAVGRSLSHWPSSPHRSPSPVFQGHLNPVILVKNRNPSAIHNSLIPIKPTRLSLHGSEVTTHKQSLPHSVATTTAEISPLPSPGG